MIHNENNKKPKIIIILGPTSSGKSDLAVELALAFNGEVISADSRQVYKGLDIGTGKITKTEMRKVPHHLLDVISPKKQFSANDFTTLAEKQIKNMLKNKKLPIIAGGTMFYIDILTGDVSIPAVPPSKNLRAKLENKSVNELFTQLKELNPQRAKAMMKDGQDQNKRRIIRAIEIASNKSAKNISFKNKFEILKIGIKTSKDTLRKRIKLRTQKRIRAGMVSEAKKLHKKGLTYKRMRALGLEYKHLADFLQNKITKDELIWRIERDDWRYARKQLSWWKRDKSIKWFTLGQKDKIQKEVKRFLSN